MKYIYAVICGYCAYGTLALHEAFIVPAVIVVFACLDSMFGEFS